jgi:hypothetical protein
MPSILVAQRFSLISCLWFWVAERIDVISCLWFLVGAADQFDFMPSILGGAALLALR